ncbi:MAG: hypothetical protein Q9N67_04485 [Ghiorsea sp.]|nr:hypothetical protein [Ghiorsea sp.]
MNKNKMGQTRLINIALGLNAVERCEVYKGLFVSHVDSNKLEEIREATNKSWVLGSSLFKERIEELTARQAQPKGRGGDRKSKKYQERV